MIVKPPREYPAEFVNQPSFAAGEVSPDLYGRVDQEFYYIALRTVRNWIVRQYGGASTRPGTRIVGEAKYPDKPFRLIRFQFNEEQTYAIELGHQYMRIIADGGQVVESAKTITGITAANPGVVTSNTHGFSDGDDVFISGVNGMLQVNDRWFRVANATANTFSLKDYLGNDIDTSGYYAYTSSGSVSRIYTVATPWDSDDLFDLNLTQSNDTLTIVHQDYYPRDITRTANTAWTVSNFANEGGPFTDKNAGTTTVQASAVSGSGITITASAALFNSGMVGELFYIEQEPDDATAIWEAAKSITTNDIRRAGTNYYKALNTKTTGSIKPDWVEGSAKDGNDGVQWQYLHSGFGIVQITGYTDTTHVTATVINRLPDNVVSTATTIWAKAAWSAAEGYPGAVVYHKGRIIFASTPTQPSTVWYSKVKIRKSFAVGNPVLDDEAITIALNATDMNAVRHLLPLQDLIGLTTAAEFLLKGDQDGSVLATSPPNPIIQGYTGASRVPPIIIGNTGLMVQDMGSAVHSLKYQLDSDSFGGIDLTARSPHLFRNKRIIDWAYQRHPFSVIWTVMSDGSLNGFTFMEEQRVYAWHRHDSDDASFITTTAIREGNTTSAYFGVEREVNGNTHKYIEVLSDRLFDSVEEYCGVDCAVTYDGRNTDTTTITVTGGTLWTKDAAEDLTLTSSTGIFTQLDADDSNYISFWVTHDDGTEVRLDFQITAYTSATVVTAICLRDVPTSHRATARTDWNFAKRRFFGFDYIEGKDIAVLADGNVVPDLSVADGMVLLPEPAYIAHFGLGYVCDLETLDLATPTGSTKGKMVSIPAAHITVQEAKTIAVGTNGFDRVKRIPARSTSLGYDLPIAAETKLVTAILNTQYSRQGRICIREDQPVPVTVNCITLELESGDNG